MRTLKRQSKRGGLNIWNMFSKKKVQPPVDVVAKIYEAKKETVQQCLRFIIEGNNELARMTNEKKLNETQLSTLASLTDTSLDVNLFKQNDHVFSTLLALKQQLEQQKQDSTSLVSSLRTGMIKAVFRTKDILVHQLNLVANFMSYPIQRDLDPSVDRLLKLIKTDKDMFLSSDKKIYNSIYTEREKDALRRNVRKWFDVTLHPRPGEKNIQLLHMVFFAIETSASNDIIQTIAEYYRDEEYLPKYSRGGRKKSRRRR